MQAPLRIGYRIPNERVQIAPIPRSQARMPASWKRGNPISPIRRTCRLRCHSPRCSHCVPIAQRWTLLCSSPQWNPFIHRPVDDDRFAIKQRSDYAAFHRRTTAPLGIFTRNPHSAPCLHRCGERHQGHQQRGRNQYSHPYSWPPAAGGASARRAPPHQLTHIGSGDMHSGRGMPVAEEVSRLHSRQSILILLFYHWPASGAEPVGRTKWLCCNIPELSRTPQAEMSHERRMGQGPESTSCACRQPGFKPAGRCARSH